MNLTSSFLRPPRVWLIYAIVLALAPLLFGSGLSLTLMSQMGIAIVACLSYNILLGQGGMLSFGHAVYTGMGAYLVIHALNLAGAGRLPIPVSLLPILGGGFSLLIAALLGYLITKKAGTPFAMITLGIGELVFALSLIVAEFFGGEGGISGNRVVGAPVLGISFGPQIQMYYLIAAYCFVCTGLMYAFTHTPLGRMLSAVRDNPQRVAYVGYSTQRVRYYGFMVSGFFAGIAGGLAALNFEIVTPEVLSAAHSGAYLFFTFLGGTQVFFGPIIGAVLMVVAQVLLSEWTKAWLLYLGLVFTLVVMYAPGGIASLIQANLRVARHGRLRALALPYLGLAGAGLVLLAGTAVLIEMTYHIQLDAALSPNLKFLGATLNTQSMDHWAVALAVCGAGGFLFGIARRRFARCWGEIQARVAEDMRAQGSGA